ncbi:MAG TPA: histone deacetylase [Longimicrobiales bacterium]|nr:histone deacetylase [Longimicrobiales bacterium]
MRIFYCHEFVLPLPPGHRFPMEKYARLYERVAREARRQPDLDVRLGTPRPASDLQLLRVHTSDYVAAVSDGRLTSRQVRDIGFPWSPGLVERSRRSVGGTIEAARWALREGASANLAGGTHHARADRGAGFCVFNDVAVAARAVLAEGLARRVLIVDLDVHQGEGTAAIFAGDRDVFTFSVHAARNFPFRKETSDLDIALDDGTGDGVYLEAVRDGLARAVAAARPQLVLYIAGADPYEGDRLGRLAVSVEGLEHRDRAVLEAAEHAGAGVAVVMGGGYAADIARTVEIHFASVRTAAQWRAVRQWRRAARVAG